MEQGGHDHADLIAADDEQDHGKVLQVEIVISMFEFVLCQTCQVTLFGIGGEIQSHSRRERKKKNPRRCVQMLRVSLWKAKMERRHWGQLCPDLYL